MVSNRAFRTIFLTYLGPKAWLTLEPSLARLLHQIGYAMKLLRSHNQIKTGQILLQCFPPTLGHAAQKTQHHPWVFLSQSAEIGHFSQGLLLR